MKRWRWTDILSIEGAKFLRCWAARAAESPLLRMLAGFETPTSGKILLGARHGRVAAHERPINMMFQSYALFPHLNVGQHRLWPEARGPAQRQIQNAPAKCSIWCSWARFAKRKPHQLSGGSSSAWRWRAAGQAAQVVALDEPLGALDKELREQTQFELVNIIESGSDRA